MENTGNRGEEWMNELQAPSSEDWLPTHPDSIDHSSSPLEIVAEGIARRAHDGQFRNDGVTPYITHVEAVALQFKEESGELKATAWLHDVIEDTPLHLEELLQMGIPPAVVDAVGLLTKKSGEDYEVYIGRIKSNPLAKAVKIADMRHNLSSSPSQKNKSKYEAGLAYLLGN